MAKNIEVYTDDIMIGLLNAVDYVEEGDLKLMRKVISEVISKALNVIMREELIKFYEAMHIKMGMTIDVPCGISIIEDVDEYLESLK